MSNTDEGSNLVQTLSVRQVPTYALYENDVFVKQKGGIATKDQLKEWIMND
jgi:thioredoxin-like negative regulator of GroEL